MLTVQQNLPRCFVEKEGGHCGQGKAVRCEGHKCQSEGYYGGLKAFGHDERMY